jgi:hypothetical protein
MVPWLVSLVLSPALAGGDSGGPVLEPLERLYTCWECGITLIEALPVPTGYQLHLVDFVSYGLSGEECEANLVADVLAAYAGYDPIGWGFELKFDLVYLHSVTLSPYWVQAHMDNGYVGDLENMPQDLVCDDTPWVRELLAVKRR